MSAHSLTTLAAGQKIFDASAIEMLASRLRGSVLGADDEAYDEARAIWNGMIDRKPGLIIRCTVADDVVAAVGFARDNGLLVSIRGGGHGIAGNAVCDGGVMIDLSQMTSVRVDATARRAWVEPGATLADVDRETQAVGLIVPTGINSTTGIAGLTLGGGFGWITRKFGLTLDSLISVEIVTADGELRRASPSQDPELFWALRGGGGNFGVVTGFEFQLHAFGPQVYSGLVVHPLSEAETVLREYRQTLEGAPDELTCWAVMRQAPPLPFLGPEWHGKEVLILAMCYCGDLADGETATARLRSIGKPIADVVGAAPFTAWQQAFDPLLTRGARNYWKTHDFADLSDATIAILLDAVRHLPSSECEIFIAHVGGAAGRVPMAATAFPQRASHFVMNVHARWQEQSMDQRCTSWARDLFQATKPHSAGTAYINFMASDEADRVQEVYGANYHRLAALKRRYDPSNLFRMNQNVMPSANSQAA